VLLSFLFFYLIFSSFASASFLFVFISYTSLLLPSSPLPEIVVVSSPSEKDQAPKKPASSSFSMLVLLF